MYNIDQQIPRAKYCRKIYLPAYHLNTEVLHQVELYIVKIRAKLVSALRKERELARPRRVNPRLSSYAQGTTNVSIRDQTLQPNIAEPQIRNKLDYEYLIRRSHNHYDLYRAEDPKDLSGEIVGLRAILQVGENYFQLILGNWTGRIASQISNSKENWLIACSEDEDTLVGLCETIKQILQPCERKHYKVVQSPALEIAILTALGLVILAGNFNFIAISTVIILALVSLAFIAIYWRIKFYLFPTLEFEAGGAKSRSATIRKTGLLLVGGAVWILNIIAAIITLLG